MNRSYFTTIRRPALALSLIAMLGAGLGGCASPEQRHQARLYQDTTTCSEFGANSGSRAYTDCMLAQQNRRDNKQRNALEQAALSTQISKDSLDITRKVQCDRDAKKDREAGQRPRRCD
jgi:hypothetical protein